LVREKGYGLEGINSKDEFLLRRHPPPKFVVIQLGSNDLSTVKGWQLAENIICDILRSRTKIVENLHYGDQDDVPLVLKPLLYQPNILYSILISK
jgi:lysophospholipase L1-like esterase